RFAPGGARSGKASRWGHVFWTAFLRADALAPCFSIRSSDETPRSAAGLWTSSRAPPIARETVYRNPLVTCSFEKTTFSRRWSRPPSRRWHFLEESRVLLRENGIFPKMVVSWFDLPCPENGTFLIFGTLSVIRAKRKQLKIKET